MKTIGLLGGMSWESTVTYYQLINRGIKDRLGGLHSASLAMVSVDFHDIEKMQHAGDWDGTARVLADAAQSIQAAGAEGLLICTNTMHKVSDQVQAAVDIPLIHIADATAGVINSSGYRKIGLLGTAFTMEQDFYKGRLRDEYGIEVLTPDSADREFIHDVIYHELCLGEIKQLSRDGYVRIIDKLRADGAEAVVLGCTEIPLLIEAQHSPLPLLDTTALHAAAAVDFMLG